MDILETTTGPVAYDDRGSGHPIVLLPSGAHDHHDYDELRDLLSDAGFEELGVYGTYQGDPFEGFRRQLLYVGRKA